MVKRFNPDKRRRPKVDDHFGDWKWREALAESMVPMIGKLYRNGIRLLMQDSADATENNILAVVSGTPFTDVPDDLFIPPDALELLLDTFKNQLIPFFPNLDNYLVYIFETLNNIYIIIKDLINNYK